MLSSLFCILFGGGPLSFSFCFSFSLSIFVRSGFYRPFCVPHCVCVCVSCCSSPCLAVNVSVRLQLRLRTKWRLIDRHSLELLPSQLPPSGKKKHIIDCLPAHTCYRLLAKRRGCVRYLIVGALLCR